MMMMVIQWCIDPNLWYNYRIHVSLLYDLLPSVTCSEMSPATEVDNSAATSKRHFSPMQLALALAEPDSSG